MTSHALVSDFKSVIFDSASSKSTLVFENAPDREPRDLKPTPRAECPALIRKLGLLKHCGLFGEDTKGAIIARACDFDDLRQAFRLVHDVYLSSGYIHPEPAGMRVRLFETLCENATFIAKKDGRVVGVLSMVGDSSDLGLPSDGVFKEEFDALRKTGVRLCELTNQAVAKEFRKSAVPTELMRCALAHGVKAGYDAGVAAVSPSHNGFYDLMGFRQIGEERSYSEKIHDPVVALTMDFTRFFRPKDGMNATEQFFRDFLTDGNRFLNCVTDWALEARSKFMNPELLARLFVIERNFLAECSIAELKILQNRWGHELFQAVTETWHSCTRRAQVLDGLGGLIGLGAENGEKTPWTPTRRAHALWRRLVTEFEHGVVHPLCVVADIVLSPIEKFCVACGDAVTDILTNSRNANAATPDSPAEV